MIVFRFLLFMGRGLYLFRRLSPIRCCASRIWHARWWSLVLLWMAWKLRQRLLLWSLDSFLHIWLAWSFVSSVYCCFISDSACLIKFSVHRMLFALTQSGLNHTFVCALPTEAERVVGWARNHHLGLCLSDPPTNKGKLIIPQNMLSL